VPTDPVSRDALFERTFTLFWRHLALWMSVLVPAAASGAAVYWAVGRLVAGVLPGDPAPHVEAAAVVMPRLAAAAWIVAGMVAAQAIALRAAARGEHWLGTPPAGPTALAALLARVGPRFVGTLAATILVIVHVAVLGALGAGAAAALASLPLDLLPKLGASAGTARSISVLVLLPLLVAGSVPGVWWLSRHVLAIPLQALEGGSPWASLRAARAATRGRVGTVLGLLVVTALAGNIVILLARAAGSLGTLVAAPDHFRPIVGEGPLRSAAGSGVQLGATLAATFVALPLMLLPLAVLALALQDPVSSGADAAPPRG
jgi:hypothetical protein